MDASVDDPLSKRTPPDLDIGHIKKHGELVRPVGRPAQTMNRTLDFSDDPDLDYVLPDIQYINTYGELTRPVQTVNTFLDFSDAPDHDYVLPDIQYITQGELIRPVIRPVEAANRILDFSDAIMPERACTDNYVQGGPQFCKLYKISQQSRELMLSRLQEPESNSPSKPFFKNPRLGIDNILNCVFRAKGELCYKPRREMVFTAWIACPATEGQDVLAMTAGHSFTKEFTQLKHADTTPFVFGDNIFSVLTGCFGRDVGTSEFRQCGFDCSPQPLAVVNDGDQDLAIFKILRGQCAAKDLLLPCSPQLECSNDQKFMATFTYPCAQTFLVQAYEELIEEREDHGIMDLYKFLAVEKAELYRLLYETFESIHDGSLICSPGAISNVSNFNCFYKCSTVGGSSGGPVVPTHRPGYMVGIHSGTRPHADFNVATSTDAPAFVNVYSKYVLPSLPPRANSFWLNYDLAPFERWLKKHHLVWQAVKVSTWADELQGWWRVGASAIKAIYSQGLGCRPKEEERQKLKLESELIITPPATIRAM